MSANVDKRIVEMQFDNAQFENGIQTSIKSLDNLEKSLNLKDAATKGFQAVADASKNLDLNSIANNIDMVSNRFSNFGIVGMTVLQNITTAAMQAGKSILESLTIEPVKMGFDEYETQINAIQTIMANTSSKGTSLDQINEALDELNRYADLTIYNFTEMTKNIGTFTAAGVDLETAVAAIKGVANLGAISGSTSQQVSTAMYQLSQALAAGRVSLMDWNSVVNAGMGGEVFQESLKETARVHGIAIDEMIEKNGSFRESLTKEGWLTSEILTETLAKFTGDLSAEQLKAIGYTDEQIQKIIELGETANDAATKVKTFTQLFSTIGEAIQSGWTNTWEIIIGDFEEAKSFLTDISDLTSEYISKSADSRNNFLKEVFSKDSFVTEADWTNLKEAGYALEDFQDILTSVAKTHGVDIQSMISNGKSFESSLESGWLTIDIFNEALNGMAATTEESSKSAISSLDDLKDMVNQVIRGDWGNGAERKNLLEEAGFDYTEIQNAVNKTLDGLELGMEDLTSAQKENISTMNEQSESMKALQAAAQDANTPVSELINKLSQPSGRELFVETIKSGLTTLLNVIDIIKTSFSEAFPVMPSQVYNVIKAIHDFIVSLELTAKSSEQLRITFTEIFSVISVFTNAIATLIKMGFMVLDTIIKNINFDFGQFITSIGLSTIKVTDLINSFVSGIATSKAFELVLTAIGTAVSYASKGVSLFLDVLSNLYELAKGEIKIIWAETIATKLTTLQTKVSTLRDTFSLLYDIIKDGFVIPGLIEASELLKVFSDNAGLSKDKLAKLYDTLKEKIVITGIEVLAGTLASLIGLIQKFGETATPILDSISKKLKETFGTSSPFAAFVGFVKEAMSAIATFGKFIVSTLSEVFNWLKSQFGNVDLEDIGAFAVIAYTLNLINTLLKQPMEILESVNEVFGALEKTLNSFTQNVKAKTLIMIAASVGILAASIAVLSNTVNTDNFIPALASVGLMLAEAVASLVVLSKITINPVKLNAAALAMILIAASIGVLASAIEKLSEYKDIGDMVPGLVGVAGGIISLTAAVSIMAKAVSGTSSARIIAASVSLVIFALAIKQLSDTILMFKDSSLEEVAKGMTPILTVLLALELFFKSMNAIDLNNGAKSLKDIGIALVAIAGAIKLLGAMNSEELTKGLIAVSTSMVGLGVAMKIMNSSTGKTTAASILGMAAALTLLIIPIEVLGRTDFAVLEQGIASIAALAVVLSVALASMSAMGTGGYASIGVGLLSMAAALTLMVVPLTALGNMSLETLGKGLFAVASALTIFGLASQIFSASSTKMMSAAVAIGLLAVSMSLLAVPIAILGNIPFPVIAQGLISISVALLAIGTASSMMKSTVSNAASIAILAAALTLLIIPIQILGRMDIEKLQQGLASLLIVLVSVTAAMGVLGALSGSMTSVGTGLLLLAASLTLLMVPLILLGNLSWDTLSKGLVTMAGALIIVAGTAALLSPFTVSLGALSLLLASVALVLLSFGASALMFASAVTMIVTSLQMLATMGADGAQSAVDALRTLALGVVTVVPEAVVAFITALTQAIPQILAAIGQLIITIIQTIFTYLPQIFMTAVTCIAQFIAGIASMVGSVINVIKTVIVQSGILDAIASKFGEILQKGKEAISKVIEGIKSKASEIIQSGRDVIDRVIEGIKSKATELFEAGANAIDGFIQGITSKVGDLWNAAQEIGKGFLDSVKNALDEHSPSKEMDQVGVYSIMGFLNAISRMMSSVWNAGQEVGNTVLNSIRNSIQKASDLINTDLDLSPTIRPTLDLREIQNGINTANSLVDKISGFNFFGYTPAFVGIDSNGQMASGQNSSTSFNFTQNNYSPKALSRVDIYRQTKNQFSMVKEAVNKR